MRTASQFETLTKRKVLIRERTERFISDLRRLVQLLDADINIEEERTGIFDLTNPLCRSTAVQDSARESDLYDLSIGKNAIGACPISTAKDAGDVDHLKVPEHDPEGVAFEYAVLS